MPVEVSYRRDLSIVSFSFEDGFTLELRVDDHPGLNFAVYDIRVFKLIGEDSHRLVLRWDGGRDELAHIPYPELYTLEQARQHLELARQSLEDAEGQAGYFGRGAFEHNRDEMFAAMVER